MYAGVDVDADLIAHARACHDRFLAKAAQHPPTPDEQGAMGQGEGLESTRMDSFRDCRWRGDMSE